MAKQKTQSGFIVSKPFRDADEHIKDGVVNYYNVGDDVSHFDAQRLTSLKDRGLVSGSAKDEDQAAE